MNRSSVIEAGEAKLSSLAQSIRQPQQLTAREYQCWRHDLITRSLWRLRGLAPDTPTPAAPAWWLGAKQ